MCTKTTERTVTVVQKETKDVRHVQEKKSRAGN